MQLSIYVSIVLLTTTGVIYLFGIKFCTTRPRYRKLMDLNGVNCDKY